MENYSSRMLAEREIMEISKGDYMKIRIGKYVWNSKKCIPLQVIKYVLLAVAIYFEMLVIYFALEPYSTMG
jgi:hypothetical protein